MRLLVALAALVIMLVVLSDAFEAMVLPRRATRKYRPARIYYRSLWLLWRGIARWFPQGGKRYYFLSIFGPLSLLGLFATWATALILSFALLHWSLGAALGDGSAPPDLPACLYLSGETLFTLGYGDLAPRSWTGRFLSVLESGLGFGFMAVVIGYLPVLYQAFSHREQVIALLDARAGSPPTAGELLRRLAKTGKYAHVDPMLWEWERWAADLLESQLSFPVLAYYRSQHDNQSWLAGLATMLDSCALLLANVQDLNRYQVQITFAMARHAAVDLTLIFRAAPCNLPRTRLPEAAYQQFLQDLAALKVNVDPSAAARARLDELRALYEPFLAALATFFQVELPPIIASEVAADNWQRSPWQQRAPGIGALPSVRPDEHFS